jgi:hypothetical protein
VEAALAGFYPRADENPGPVRALFERQSDDSRESVMLLLFGRYKDPARLGLGIVIVIIGIVIHQLIITLVGAVLAVWGGYLVAGSLRNRRRNAGQGGDTGGDGGER